MCPPDTNPAGIFFARKRGAHMWQAVALPKPAASTTPAQETSPITPDCPAGPPYQSAVHRCTAAYNKAINAAGGAKAAGARDAAEAAFRRALPDITDRASAYDFIACIVKGMVLRIFFCDEGPRLIAGARASLAALPPQLGLTPPLPTVGRPPRVR
jgi:hypothetical protein